MSFPPVKRERKTSDHDLQSLLDLLDCGVVKISFDGEMKRSVLWANKGFYALTGRSKEEYEQQEKSGNPANVLHPDDFRPVFKKFHAHVRNRKNLHIQYRVFHKDGHIVWLDVKSCFIGIENGHPVFMNVMMDITHEKALNDMIEMERKKYVLLSKISNEIIFEYDIKNDNMKHFGSLERHIDKRNINNFLKKPDQHKLIHPDDYNVVNDLLQKLISCENKIRQSEKFRIYIEGLGFRWHYCNCGIIDESTIIGKLVDIHDTEEKLHYLNDLTSRDPMTRLLNKEFMRNRCAQILHDSPGRKHAMLIIDIDDFKIANDTNGHKFGDSVIHLIAETLQNSFRSDDLIGRIGGDEFLLLLHDVSREQALLLADKYRSALASVGVPFASRFRISNSIGISVFPEDGVTYEELFEAADRALYRAKAQGKNRVASASFPD